MFAMQWNMEDALRVCGEESWEDGLTKGREEGRFDTVVLNIKNLMVNMDWTAQKAMDVLCVPQVDRQAIMEALN